MPRNLTRICRLAACELSFIGRGIAGDGVVPVAFCSASGIGGMPGWISRAALKVSSGRRVVELEFVGSKVGDFIFGSISGEDDVV